MITRPNEIQRAPNADFRVRGAIDDIRNWIENTPRYDTRDYSATVVQSTAGGANTTLFSTVIYANTLNENGDALDVEASVKYAANANNKRISLNFGGTDFVNTGLVPANNASAVLRGKIVRTSSTRVRYMFGICSTYSGLQGISNVSEFTVDLTTDLTLSLIGNGTLLNDVSGWLWHVAFLPRP